MRKYLLILSLMPLITGLSIQSAHAQNDIIFLGPAPVPYEDRLNFIHAVESIMAGLNERITELEALKADPYTTIYSTVKQKKDAIDYRLRYLDTIDREEWSRAQQDIVERVNDLAADLRNLPNVSQGYSVPVPVIMVRSRLL